MWTVKRDDLNEVLDVLAMVSEKKGIPSSEYFWIRRNKKHGIKITVSSYTSGEVTLEGKGDWPFNDHFFVDRRTFVPWVGAARESKDKHLFEFHEQDGQLMVRHGSRSVLFSNQKKIQGYGNLSAIKKNSKNTIPVSKELRELLSCGSTCAVSDTIQPHLNCVYTIGKGDKVVSYAANDLTFYIGKGDVGGKLFETVPFPLFLINLLTVDGLKEITHAGKHILLRFKHGVIWQPVSEEANTKFPVDKIKKYAKLSHTLPSAFTSSSRRFSRLIVRMGYYMQSERKRDWMVTVKGSRGDKQIRVRGEFPGIFFREKLDVIDKVKQSFHVEWPLGALVRVFDYLSKNTKKMPLVLHVDTKHHHSYVRAGGYWLMIPSKQK